MIYKNSEIFRDLGDYVLGGFTTEELAKLKIIGEDSEITENKLKHFCQKRMAVALKVYFIESYKEYCIMYDEVEARLKTYEQIRSIVYEYLNIALASDNDLESIASELLASDQYLGWQIDFLYNFNQFTNSLLRVDLSSKTESGIEASETEIEEVVKVPDLIQILEKISE